MQIVINMPDDICNRIRHLNRCVDFLDACRDRDMFVEAIKNGTPLPKGHGDLKDANEIKEFYRKKLVSNLVDETRGLDWSEYAELPCKAFNEVIDNVPTIIEADKVESEGKG